MTGLRERRVRAVIEDVESALAGELAGGSARIVADPLEALQERLGRDPLDTDAWAALLRHDKTPPELAADGAFELLRQHRRVTGEVRARAGEVAPLVALVLDPKRPSSEACEALRRAEAVLRPGVAVSLWRDILSRTL